MIQIKTASGSEYTLDFDSGFWTYKGEKHKIVTAKSVPLDTLARSVEDDDMWDDIDALPSLWNGNRSPNVGDLLFVASQNYWRLTTAIVSVEEVENEVVAV